jgi:hypothetical protein
MEYNKILLHKLWTIKSTITWVEYVYRFIWRDEKLAENFEIMRQFRISKLIW